MIDTISRSIKSSTEFHKLLSFEFAKNGALNFTLNLKNEVVQPLGIFFCQQMDLVNQLEQRMTFTDFCNRDPIHHLPCDGGVRSYLNTTQPTFDLQWIAPKRMFMWVVSVNCAAKKYSLEGDYVAVNPGGEYLSLNQVPYKPLFIVLGFIWLALIFVWISHWVQYRFFNFRLQAFLTLLPILQMGSCVLWEYYYRVCSETGHLPQMAIVWTVLGISSTATTIVFLALLYIAEGWGVLKKNLTQTRLVWSMCGSFWLASMLMNVYQSFVFVLVFFYLLILRNIFQAHSRSITLLRQQYDCIKRVFPQHHLKSPIYEKILLYKNFQKVVVIFVAIDIIFRWWARNLLIATPWISTLLQHLMLIVLCGALGWTFRLKPFYPHFFMLTQQQDPEMADDERPLLGDVVDREWRPGDVKPDGYKSDYQDWLAPGAGQIALVKNEGTDNFFHRWWLAVPMN